MCFRKHRFIEAIMAFVCATAFGSASRADILVTQIAPMTGPIAAEGQEYNVGIRIAFDGVNARGGIQGQRLTLHTWDDEYKPANTVAMIRKAAATETVALILPVGSPSLTKVLQEKVLENARIPVIGVVPGAEPFRTPINPFLYHVRAGDIDQFARIVEHSYTVGRHRMGVVYADIPFGKAGLSILESMLKSRSLEPAVRVALPVAGDSRLTDAVARLRQAVPDVIVLVSPGQLAGEFVRAYRASGLEIPIITLSYGTADIICRAATSEKARGVSVAQVFPNVNGATIPLSRRFQADFKRFGPAEGRPSQSQFEGYVTAQVLIEGLRRTGANPTREKLMQSLDGMHNVDLGGFVVDFSSAKHTGSSFVDIGIISRNCQLLY